MLAALLTGTTASIFSNLTLEDIEECSQCGYRFLCRGGCRAEVLERTGTTGGCDIKRRKAIEEYLQTYSIGS